VTADAGGLAGAVREALRRHVLTLADSKRLLGLRYSDWLLGAPSIEAGIAASGMAQDEWGHARLLYAMLKDLGSEPREVEHERPASAYASVDALDGPCEDWADVVAAIVVVDGAASVALESFAEGVWPAARSRIPKMLGEEAFHRDLGLAWLRRLGGGTDEARERMRAAVQSLLPLTLAWLGPNDEAADLLAGEGLSGPGADAIERYTARYAEAFAGVGVDLTSTVPERAGWDEERRRGPGQPDEEVVERARGDRNRALFVE
jgi:ring-1,2-phenylacetyl-CoA epoxidase subunit PaaC